MSNILFLFGRVFLSSIFMVTAMKAFFSLDIVTESFINLTGQWLNYSCSFNGVIKSLHFLLHHAVMVCWISTVIVGIGGFLLFFGLWIRMASFFLSLLLISYIILNIPVWISMYHVAGEVPLEIFCKDIAILGGLFFVFCIVPSRKNSDV